jgi:hypothetical protein
MAELAAVEHEAEARAAAHDGDHRVAPKKQRARRWARLSTKRAPQGRPHLSFLVAPSSSRRIQAVRLIISSAASRSTSSTSPGGSLSWTRVLLVLTISLIPFLLKKYPALSRVISTFLFFDFN